MDIENDQRGSFVIYRAIAIGAAVPVFACLVAATTFHGRAEADSATAPVVHAGVPAIAPAVVEFAPARSRAVPPASLDAQVRDVARQAAVTSYLQSLPYRASSTFWAADSCAVVGDSLAVGMGVQFRREGLTCQESALKGRSSGQILEAMPQRVSAAYVILSASVNDLNSPVKGIDANLRAIRSRVDAGSVVWLLPVRQPARNAVATVCAESGDRAVDLYGHLGPDGIHPKDYAEVARARGDAEDCRAIIARG